MDRYYYIASQLPFLQFDSESGFTRENFFYEAEKWLESKEYKTLEELDINSTKVTSSDAGIIVKYKEFESMLRRELMAWRKAHKEGYEHKTVLIPLATLKENHPLDIEKKLLKLRWDFLEDLELGHYFDIEFLILYHYKLQILERLKSFDREKGLENFKQYTEVGV